ncbi:MAG: tRNA uridine-5-carboxymethylaminomethyl(34) synthesis GTPase MnmE [Firmicutes bacterium]|nr:tRNA uridine-5-carboxymethylaminomethyl(34) synthesis GTPase MnmE [Bacillota bacterium]
MRESLASETIAAIATPGGVTQTSDTIAAIATPLGSGGIGIVRVSGPEAAAILGRLFRGAVAPAEMESHRLYLGDVTDERGALLDRALAVIMRAPRSYTGEDVAELQLHGGPRVLSAALTAALACGARLATPGEFTLRAFLNGKLDLSQAEAVADLIAAKTPRASKLAAGQLQGALGRAVAEIERELTAVYGAVIVGVDFPDDADAADPEQTREALVRLADRIRNDVLSGAGLTRVVKEGVRAALVGRVNAGKSSLLNALLAEERAIVTSLPGTTRDVLEESVDLEGVPLILADTAGLRDEACADEAEQMGMERSRDKAGSAQLVLVVTDGVLGITPEDDRLLREAGERALLLINKCDLLSEAEIAERRRRGCAYVAAEDVICLSAKNGAGLDGLKAALRRRVLAGVDGEAASPLVANARQEQALLRAAERLTACAEAIAAGEMLDVAAVDIGEALDFLGEISGRTASEEVLQHIFANFCLGK